MPKPIIVIQTGDIPRERFEMISHFLLTSKVTADIRDEYHILVLDIAPEACYIISADNTKVILDPAPTTIGRLMKALDAYKVRNAAAEEVKEYRKLMWAAKENEQPLKSGGISSGPSFGDGPMLHETIIPLHELHKVFPGLKKTEATPPEASPKVKQALKDMHAIRDAARQHIAEIKSSLTAEEIAEWYNVPDIKISLNNPHIKDPNELGEIFGYKVRRLTIQALEDAVTSGMDIKLNITPDGEVIIMQASCTSKSDL